MCKKCDAKLKPLKAVLGELTNMEEVTLIAGMQVGLPTEELVSMIKKNRDAKVSGSFGNKPIPDEVVYSEKTMTLAMLAMQVAYANYKKTTHKTEEPETSEEDVDEDLPFKFDEESITALLGFELNKETSKEAYKLAEAGKTPEEAFDILKRHHPMGGKVEVHTLTDEHDVSKNYVSEEQFDQLLSLFDTARVRAFKVAQVSYKLRAAVNVILEVCNETIAEKDDEYKTALLIKEAIKVGIIDKVPEAFPNFKG